MASQDGPPADHLKFLAEARDDLAAFGVFAILRQAEARARELPRMGRARRPEQDVVEIRQRPVMSFPSRSIDAIEFRNGQAILSGYWFGLTGPMGPLPLHLTEFAVYERTYSRERPFGRFLDLLARRMQLLFYRAWADSQPVAQADRPDDDRFAAYLAAISGATEGVREDAAFPAQARLHYAGLFASRRSASGIEDALTHLLGTDVRLYPFRPKWREIDRGDQSRLGGAFATLGRDTVSGSRFKDYGDEFLVVVRVRNLRELRAFLPGGARHAIASEALDAFKPSHLDWQIEIELEEAKLQGAKLDGMAQLGWTSWLMPQESERVRSDVRLRRRSSHWQKDRKRMAA